MRTRSFIFALAVLVFALVPHTISAQNGKFYTRRVLLEDFPAKITKIVLSGDSMVDAVLHEEVRLRWNLSPYEFCTVDEYESLKENVNYYFIHFVRAEGVIFLSLDKGGKKEDPDIRNRGFEVLSIPVSTAGTGTMENLTYMPAFISLFQDFVNRAMVSDGKAYSGLAYYNIKDLFGKKVCIDADRAAEYFSQGQQGMLAGILVKPASGAGSYCYKMLVSCDTQELFYYRKSKINDGEEADWSKAEKKRFNGKSAE